MHERFLKYDRGPRYAHSHHLLPTMSPTTRKALKTLSFVVLGCLIYLELPQPLQILGRQRIADELSPCMPPQPPSQPASCPVTPMVDHSMERKLDFLSDRKKVVLGKHKYRPDGLLEVNEDGPHPIYELISRAEKEWEAKLSRASKTLEDAVAEYSRRYKRDPPKGFDLWWKYVEENGVQLPDEYDQIHLDLEHFHGIEPADLIKTQQENEVKLDTYTIGQNETGEVEVLTYAFQEGRYNQLIAQSREILKMLNQIHHLLPPFRITITPHDGPNRLTDYGVKTAALDAVAGRTYLERAALPKTHSIGWVSACSPNSLARRKPINLDSPPPRHSKKTFIHDHVLTMDPCNHPALFFHHGQFLSHDYGPGPQNYLVPEFSSCSTMLHHNIRMPTPYGWVEDIMPRENDPEWDEKFDERLLWRGTNTGMRHSKTSRWKYSQRDFLVASTNDLTGTLTVIQPNTTRSQPMEPFREVRKSRINPELMDVAFGGGPSACEHDVCEMMKEIYPFRERQTIKQAGNYRYVMDVDGNGWSGRFKRLITSNSLIFKSTIYPEWFADRVAPWVHYVPIQVDLSDLHDAVLFFRGDGSGTSSQERLGRKIAAAGRQWSKTFWRKEDLTAYFFRLILEYARLMSLDRESMSFTLDDG
ncbi:hypothetical protein D9619_010501 [Psilocybe cf. subviscida]|uniref:Glycosyl transferase CAP10 domain-containing protein n=1 Tax=Psilocybe cf. subviscida TaxID=2480587 RepID=A0A8H5AS39_9AGAR|nr:hypothetical protein D9619_010501 [Psilocybe cf. subviscida]